MQQHETDLDAAEIVPLLQEQLEVRTQLVEAGRVRISKTVHAHEEVVDVPLQSEHVSVEHVQVYRVVQEPPAIRYEGDVMIIPVLEEVLVVEKRLILREEIRVTTHRTQAREQQVITLRTETAEVERVDAGDALPK